MPMYKAHFGILIFETVLCRVSESFEILIHQKFSAIHATGGGLVYWRWHCIIAVTSIIWFIYCKYGLHGHSL